jgi:hypothetical protein
VRLTACSVNRTRRLIKAPKIYWGDTDVGAPTTEVILRATADVRCTRRTVSASKRLTLTSSCRFGAGQVSERVRAGPESRLARIAGAASHALVLGPNLGPTFVTCV